MEQLIRYWYLGIVLTCVIGTAYASGAEAHKTIMHPAPGVELVVGGSDLADAVHLFNARIGRIGAFKRGMVSVQNRTDDRVTLEYKFEWLDDEGFPVGDEAGIWERFVLGPREVRTFRSLGKSRRAASMRFTLRYPGDTFIENDLRQQGKWSSHGGLGGDTSTDVLDEE